MPIKSPVVSFAVFLFVVLSTPVLLPGDAGAQGGGAPAVSMVTLQVVPGQQGQQMVVTPRGVVVPLPGAGVDSNVVQIYIGSQGGYWYVDKYGQPVDLTASVQRLQAMSGQSQPVQTPQYAPAPTSEQSSSSGGGTGATAAAAGLGAMTGAALAGMSYYNNVPYGTPMYYGAGARPYYVGAGGNNVYVNNSQTANVVNHEVHANNLQKQQEWYTEQSRRNTDQFQNWRQNQENPFVRQEQASALGGDDAGQRRRFGRNRQGGDGAGGPGFEAGGGAQERQRRFGRGGDRSNGPGAEAGGGLGERFGRERGGRRR